MKLDMRMNLKTRKVEIKTTGKTDDTGALQRAADFVHAFILGFEIQGADGHTGSNKRVLRR